ncbi:MAG: DUF131 domain-containing protein [Candidatus Bathyarchaeota archaeon]|nr:DUF131 domain-containing protein [Candidatus Bathyarchaeota archaeon]
MDFTVLFGLGIALIIIGIAIMVAAIILASTGGGRKGKVKGAGVIMVGPIPIIFGTDKKSVKTVLAMALALTVALFILWVVYFWFLR